jgi:beta-lactamase class C
VYLKYFTAFLCLISASLSAALFTNEEPYNTVKIHIDQVMKTQKVPGVAVALIYDNKIYLYNFGLANISGKKKVTPDTIFEIASVTKVFTATALAIEVLDNNMTLNDPVTDYLPQLKNRAQPVSKIKLVDLATHTSSLPRESPSRNQPMAFLSEWSPSYPVGTKYVYSNVGFGILGEAIANKEGLDYEQMIQKLVTGPLGMKSTFVQVPADLQGNYAQGYNKEGTPIPMHTSNTLPGGGALHSTSRDMLKFLSANLGLAGAPEISQAMSFAQKGHFRVNYQLSMGLAWQRFSTKQGLLIIDKNGGLPGFSSYIGLVPEKRMGIVLLINKAKTNATRVGRSILITLEKAEFEY